MKRILFAVFISAMMAVSGVAATAEEAANPESVAAGAPVSEGTETEMPDFSVYETNEKTIRTDRRSTGLTFTTDEVIIDSENSVYTVNTDTISMRVEVPFGFVCITQDISQQLDLYLALYTDAGTALDNYISHGVHLNLYDLLSGLDVNLFVSDNSLAQLVGDLCEVPEAFAQQVFSYVAQNWYDGVSCTLETVGGRPYFLVDARKEYGFISYITFVGGRETDVICYADAEDEEAAANVAYLVECLNLSTIG